MARSRMLMMYLPLLKNITRRLIPVLILTPPVGRNVSEAIRQIKAYQLVRKTGGKEVTPSGWQEGGRTLKPGIDLVGNIADHWTVADSYK